MEKKIILSLISLLIIGSFISFANAIEIEGNAPIVTIVNIANFDKFNSPIEKAYYTGESIVIDAIISDSEGWSDVKNPDLVFGENRLNCYRTEVISSTIAKYKCSLTILESMQGSTDIYLEAVDQGGLERLELIGNYYFNPEIDLTTEPILFNPHDWIMGSISETDWVRVDIETPTTNPVKVSLYGKNLYAELEDLSNCQEESVCTKYERVCSNKIVRYLSKTKTVCERANGRRICQKIPYQKPVYKRVCEYTDECAKWKTTSRCANNIGRCGNGNMMALENFQYQLYGEDWKPLKSLPNKEIIFSGSGSSSFYIKFKVNIPEPCYGNYILDGRNIFIGLA